VLFSVARTPCRAEVSEHIDWPRAARNALAIYGKGGMYVNFPGDAQEGDVDRSYPSQNRARLQAVRNQYDPLNVFRFNINIGQPHGEGELSEIQHNIRRCTSCPRRIDKSRQR
jgi:hypothetical protein